MRFYCLSKQGISSLGKLAKTIKIETALRCQNYRDTKPNIRASIVSLFVILLSLIGITATHGFPFPEHTRNS